MRRKEINAAARVLATMAAVLMVGGCATKGDIRSLREELRDLALRQDSLMMQLRQQTLSTQDTVRQQSNQIVDFRGDISSQLRDIRQTLVRLEALAGESQRGIVGVRDQLANMRRLPAVGTDAMGGSDTTSASSAVVPGAGVGPDPTSMFNAGVRQFNRGSFTAAKAAFDSFLQTFPNDELAPDAHYYLASILEQEDRPEDALSAFQKIPELFPTAGKVPDALYRIGMLQLDLGQQSDARETFTRVVNTYPDSDVATLAQEELRKLGR